MNLKYVFIEAYFSKATQEKKTNDLFLIFWK